MPFQFLCPQGHLLQGDEAHMGMQTQCPNCGVLFIIPTIETLQVASRTEASGGQHEFAIDPHGASAGDVSLGDFLSTLGAGASSPDMTVATGASAATPPTADPATKVEPEPALLHIPCPNGHELETPVEMLGQDVLCPHCKSQFHLRREDSIEAQQERELRDLRRGEAWLRWSIVAAVIVVVGLLAMIVMSHLN